MAPKKTRREKPLNKKKASRTMTKGQPNQSKGAYSYLVPAILIFLVMPMLLAWLIFSQRIVPTAADSFEKYNSVTFHLFETKIETSLKALSQELNVLTKLPYIQTAMKSSPNPHLVEIPNNEDLTIKQVILFPRGNIHMPSPDHEPAITFNMISNASIVSRSGATRFEIEEEMLYITSRVQSETGQIIGAATAVLDKNIALDSHVSDARGLIALQVVQVIDGSEKVVLQTPSWRPGQRHNIEKKDLSDVFTVKAQWLGQPITSFFNEHFIIVLALGLGAAGIIPFLFLLMLFLRAHRHDLEILRDSMIDLFRGKNPGNEHFYVREIADTYENIYDNLKNSAAITGAIPNTSDALGVTDSLFENSEEAPTAHPPTRATFSREQYSMDLEEKPSQKTKTNAPSRDTAAVPEHIFRAYDIRGVYPSQLNEALVESIGRAIGSAAIDAGTREITLGRDGRTSGPALAKALRKGLKKSGIVVIDIGMVPTPVLYYAAKNQTEGTGVMLTGSHNPADYNGLKIMIAGETLHGDTIKALYHRIINNDLKKGTGQVIEKNVMEDYYSDLLGDIVLSRGLKVIVDSGNGVTGTIMPDIFQQLGAEVTGMYTEVDGTFPNHAPDPSQPENMADLIKKVQSEGADLGLAFDGDGDRVGVITPTGKMVYADKLMMLFAENVLAENPGSDIIFDVKCSSDLAQIIQNAGGRPLMWKTGHSLIKAKLRETKAPLAGEMSGHIFFADRWNGFDDAIYAAARLMEILSSTTDSLDELLKRYPERISTPELHVKVTDENKFEIIQKLIAQGQFGSGTVTEIDGLRVDYENGWGLLRASNTTPVLVARFEAQSDDILQMIKTKFRENLAAVAPGIKTDF